MNRRRLWWFVFFGVSALVSLSSAWLPKPLPMDAPPELFSAGRAFEDIRAIAQAPHPTGSADNQRVREYLLGRMRELGLNPREMRGEVGGVAVVNLYGEFAGSGSPAASILVVAHYDSTPRGPGAADDSTGVAVALEAVRALKAVDEPGNSIGVLFTDGEEVHGICRGANLFVHTETNLMSAIKVVVNLEARGNRGPVLMFQTGPDNQQLIGMFAKACPAPVAASFSEDVYRRMPNDTDMTEFLKAGKRGFNFAFTGGIEFYHSPEDTPENLSARTVQHYGNCVLPLVYELASSDVSELGSRAGSGDAVYFPLWRGLFVHYSAHLSRVLVIGTAILFVIALFFARRRLGVRGVAIGVGVSLLCLLVAAVISVGGLFVVARVFKARVTGPFVVGVPNSGIILIALLMIVAGAIFKIRGRMARGVERTELLAGSLAVWIAVMLVAQEFLAGASYLFMWPAMFGALALLVLAGRGFTAGTELKATASRRSPQAVWFVVLLTAAPAPLVFAITALLLHHTITIGAAPISATLLALALCLAPPWQNEVR